MYGINWHAVFAPSGESYKFADIWINGAVVDSDLAPKLKLKVNNEDLSLVGHEYLDLVKGDRVKFRFFSGSFTTVKGGRLSIIKLASA